MSKIVKLGDPTLFFWIDENGDPAHAHVSKGAVPDSTKFWLTRAGGCLLAANDSKLTKCELGIVCDYITLHFDDICDLWRETFHGDLPFLK